MPVDKALMDALPSVGMILVAGGIGQGKSCLAYGILEEAHRADPGREIFAYNFPPQKAYLLPPWITVTVDEEFPDGTVVIADEAYFAFYAKDHSNELNRFMEKFAGLARQKGILTLFITQATRKLTLAQVAGGQALLVKCPDIMMARLDRAELRSLMREALDAFRKLPDDEWQEATYLLTLKHEGLMEKTNTPPSFWTEDLSRAWEGVSLTAPMPLNSSHVICKRCHTDKQEFLAGLCQECWEKKNDRDGKIRAFRKRMRG